MTAPAARSFASSPTAHTALVLATLVPFLVLGVRLATGGELARYTAGDYAIQKIYTLQAAQGTLFVGPYSWFRWNHPGPALYYVWAAIHHVLGDATAAMCWGSLGLNLVSVLGLLVVARRAGRDAGPWVAAIAVAVYVGAMMASPTATTEFATVGAEFLLCPWNPYVTLLPFALLVVLCAWMPLAGPELLPLLVALASFLGQSHVSYLPVGAALVLTGLALHVARQGVTRRLVGAVGLSLLVAALAWALPIIENARESPGNLTALARFFGEGLAEPRGTREAFRAMARVAAAVPLAIGEAIAPIPKGVAPRLASVLVVVEIGLVALAGWLAARRARPFAASLCLVTLVGFAMATLSARQIAGPVHAYVLIWVTVLGVLGWTAIGCALVPLLPRVAPRRVGPLLAVGLLLLATAANVARIAGAPRIMPIAVEDARAVAQLHAAVRGYARDQGIARPLFDMEPLKRWGIVAGVLAELYEEGLPFAVRDRWLFMFGQPLRATGTEDSRIVFSTAEGPLPPHRVITRLEEILVYEVCGGPPARDRECRPPSPG